MAVTVAAIGAAAFMAMWLIANRLHGAARASLHVEAIKFGLGFIAAGGAIAALLLSVRRQHLAERGHQLELSKQDLELRKQTHAESDAAERRVTELFSKAVEHLGSPDAAVRLGGLYALERVAQNNVHQRQTVVDVFCAYLRMPHVPTDKGEIDLPVSMYGSAVDGSKQTASGLRHPDQEIQVRLTAQRILSTHLRRPAWLSSEGAVGTRADPEQLFWPDIDLDLTGAILVDWNLDDGIVRRSDFRKATFSGESSFNAAVFRHEAKFGGAKFCSDVSFDRTKFLKEVRFDKAKFAGHAGFARAEFTSDAWFVETEFRRDAGFEKARFSANAWFAEARFSGYTRFNEASFARDAGYDKVIFSSDTWFNSAIFSGEARFDEASLSGHARFAEATFFGNARFDDARFLHVSLECVRIIKRPRRGDVWPEGWTIAPDVDVDTLVML